MRDDLTHNYFYNNLDGALFGLGIGFATFSAVIPLFVNELTSSQTLIGLVPAVHNVTYSAPQLFTAAWVARQKYLKPWVMWITTQERLPFLLMGVLALFHAQLGVPLTLALAFVLLTWQGLGAGFTSNFWQSFIAKIFPPNKRGTFLGMQAAIANLTIAGGSIISGQVLERVAFPYNFAICFGIAFFWLMTSLWALGQVREKVSIPVQTEHSETPLLQNIGRIWRKDANFRLFLVVRSLAQFASMGFAFYTIYAVRHFQITAGAAGILGAALATSQIIGNATLGWLGDRIGNRKILVGGGITAIVSILVAMLAPNYPLFVMAVVLAGITNVTLWTITMTMTMQFGGESERPMYIGMANTLTAPATIVAPVFGGWLADISGFPLTYGMSIAAGIVMVILLLSLREPKHASTIV